MTLSPAHMLGRLDEDALSLSEEVFAEMIAHPFWLARYGDRANTNMRKDSVFHIQYLREALATNHPEVLENYTRWLQDLLTTRGMCSLHIKDNYDRLARAIARRYPGDAGPASDLLAAASRALLYPAGPARDLQDAAHADSDKDLAHLGSYLADALQRGNPQPFTAHCTFMAKLESADKIRDLLDRLSPMAPTAGELIAAARAALP
jgi:hypothetical protein